MSAHNPGAFAALVALSKFINYTTGAPTETLPHSDPVPALRIDRSSGAIYAWSSASSTWKLPTQHLASGDATAPTLSFIGDSDTGLFRAAANILGVSVAGAEVARFNTTGLSVTGTVLGGDGTFALPGFGFTGDTDTGMYRVGANQLGFTVGGTKMMTLSNSTMELVAGYVTLNQTAQPGVAAAGKGRLYLYNNGGKGRLAVIFPSGAEQVIADEP